MFCPYANHDQGSLGVLEVLLDQQILAHQSDSIGKVLLKELQQVLLIVDHLKVGKGHEQSHSERLVLYSRRGGLLVAFVEVIPRLTTSCSCCCLRGWEGQSS